MAYIKKDVVMHLGEVGVNTVEVDATSSCVAYYTHHVTFLSR